MARLVLDPMCVLSAWEEMGGSAFACDDTQLGMDDPSAFSLDLTNWEARFKPDLQLDAGAFPPLFDPTDASFGSTPGFDSAASAVPARSDSAQVVPLCPAASVSSWDDDAMGGLGGVDGLMDPAVLDEVVGGAFDEVDALPLHFPGMEPLSAASPSPSHTSSEPGVVPDLAALRSTGSTATSGSEPTSAAAAPQWIPSAQAQAGVPQLPAGLFVPIDQSGFGSGSGCFGLPALSSESADDCSGWPAEEAAQPANPAPEHKARPAAQPVARTAAAAAAAQPSGAGVHVRTRAECLERYREKKARRLYTKKIRYQLRKINADKRPRIKGRFVKKEELAEFLATQRAAPAHAGEDADMYDSDDE